MEATYTLYQVLTNARTGMDSMSDFGTYDSLAVAKKVAAKELKGCRWLIQECRTVAQSKPKVEA